MNYYLSNINQKIVLRFLSLNLFVFILLWFYPISYGLIRFAIVIVAILICTSFVYLIWHRNFILSIIFTLLITIVLLPIPPGRSINVNSLRQNYLSQLNKYENTNYIWGGENKIGIDCSGLVRKGLIKANFQEGLLTVNSDFIRTSFDLWWHDASAEALRDEYRNYTKKLFDSESINAINYQKINSGDMAVTKDGVHILAYLGDKVWIEADPLYKKVIKVSIPEVNNPWFNTPVYILRWQQFI